MKVYREYAYPEELDMCVVHGDGSISHANPDFDGPGPHNRIEAMADRERCEKMSDGSICHVPSRYLLEEPDDASGPAWQGGRIR